jgi:hypothetical protein
MKSGFHDPIEAKPKEEKKKSPWDYRAPQYDERTSCFVNAGTHYGVGHRSPVGHEGMPKSRVSTMPFGRHPTMVVDYPSTPQKPAEFQE